MKEKFEILALVPTFNNNKGRISMHGVRECPLDLQARSLGLPLGKVKLSEMPSMEEYNCRMKLMFEKFSTLGITYSIFGDIFLEDLKKYGDDRLSEIGIQVMNPL